MQDVLATKELDKNLTPERDKDTMFLGDWYAEMCHSESFPATGRLSSMATSSGARRS